MTTITSFHNRLAKIGIDVTFTGNYPWVYLDKVNGKVVRERYEGNHGFTVFFTGKEDTITNIPRIFKKLRQMLCHPEEDEKAYLKQMEDYYS